MFFKHLFRYTSYQEPGQSVAPMRTHHDQVGIELLGFCVECFHCGACDQAGINLHTVRKQFRTPPQQLRVLVLQFLGPHVADILRTNLVANEVGMWGCHMDQP